MMDVNRSRLFFGACAAMAAASLTFSVVSDVMKDMKFEFLLTNLQIGYIVGANTWGFAVSMLLLGPFAEAIGSGRLLKVAMVFHLTGVFLMMYAHGFWMLFFGAFTLTLGNGTMESVCNPMVIALFPGKSAKYLNRYHFWFPGGIVLGGISCWLLKLAFPDAWRARFLLVLVPVIIYTVVFHRQGFPGTRRLQSGLTVGTMIRGVISHPVFYMLFLSMILAGSLEVASNRWIPTILQSGGLPGILVLVWIGAIMGAMRYSAGFFTDRFSSLKILSISTAAAGCGLFWLSYSGNLPSILAASAIFAAGVSLGWPLTLSVVSERLPLGGTFALGTVGGGGALVIGLLTMPAVGKITDDYISRSLPVDQTVLVLKAISQGPSKRPDPALRGEPKAVLGPSEMAADALKQFELIGKLPQPLTVTALRGAVNTGGKASSASQAEALLSPYESLGGRRALRFLGLLPVFIIGLYGMILISDRFKQRRSPQP